MKMKILGSFLLIMFFASVGAFVTLSKKPLCIDSKVVEKIDRMSADGTVSLWRCSLNRSVPYDEKFQQYLPEISRHLSVVERFFDEVSPLSEKLEIVWLDGMDETIRLQGSQIFISQNLLFSTDQLERAMLRFWLREKAGNATIDRTLLEGSLVDLIMVSLGATINQASDQQWPSLLSSEYGICQKSPGTLDHYMMCASARNSAEESASILVGSGRPLISESFIGAYMNLSLKERTSLLQSLPQFLAHMNSFRASSLLAEDASIKDPNVLRSDIDKLQQLLADFAPWKAFDADVKNQLTLHGFSFNDSVAQLDDLVQLGPDLTLSPESIEHFHRIGKMSSLVGVADEDRLLMLPSTQPLQKKIFGALRARQLLYLSCEIPSTEKLLEFSRMTDRLLFVRFCGPISEISFKEYFTKGYAGFAQSNPQLAFVQIHLPSLLQAWKGHPGNPLPALAKQDWKNPFFPRVGWQAPTWDDSTKMFKTRSVIQAIEAYRPLAD